MNTLIDFLTLRPVFTFLGLKIVWYVYLLHLVFQLYISLTEVSHLLSQKNVSWLSWWPNAIPLVLGIVAQVALVRVLIEVAATILLSPRRSDN